MSDKINIIKGDDAQINVEIKNESLSPYDLSGVTAAKACFVNADDSILELTLGSGVTVTSASEGKIQIDISDTQSDLLKTGDDQSFELQIDESGVKQSFQFEEKLNVIDRICS